MDPAGRIRPCVSFDSAQAVFGSLDALPASEVFGSEMAFAAADVPPPTVETCAGCKWVMFCRYCVQRAILAAQWTGPGCRWLGDPGARRFNDLALATAVPANERS
jgi:radical SAM protein with 4Fe4S-binding SPASM domain